MSLARVLWHPADSFASRAPSLKVFSEYPDIEVIVLEKVMFEVDSTAVCLAYLQQEGFGTHA